MHHGRSASTGARSTSAGTAAGRTGAGAAEKNYCDHGRRKSECKDCDTGNCQHGPGEAEKAVGRIT
jgi:hypothetical protein